MRLRNQYVPSDELAWFRADPEREKQLGWNKTMIVCRECGQKRASMATPHLRFHGLTWKDYQQKWPGAPMLSDVTRSATRRAAVKYEQAHAEEHKQKAAAYRSDRKNKEKLRAIGRRRNQRRRDDPEYREKQRENDRRSYLKKRIPKATEAEVLAFQGDPYSVPYVVCLEPGCGAKLKDIACAHLVKIHGLTPEIYGQKHPGVPTKVLKKPAHRPRKDDEADRVVILKDVERKSWHDITTFLNKSKPPDQRLSQEGYRSLYRSRKSNYQAHFNSPPLSPA